ncbi:ferredoxin [Streptomyces sp. NPDC020472]|uniref:ferredoxin n=1 Tax=unclassified Streptomyces TaxID=2593676 RepID=UPI0036963BF5
MRAVECAACGNQVLCEKFSVAHTSVQWTADAAVACAEFRDRVRPGVTTARMRTCRALRASIDRAVEDGDLTVGTLAPGGPESGTPESRTAGTATTEADDA